MTEDTEFWPKHSRRIEHPHWSLELNASARMTARLASFAHLDAFLRALALPSDAIVWRGHSEPEWSLSSSLDRLRSSAGLEVVPEMTSAHLAAFKRYASGSIGPQWSPSTDGDWWALGRHYGLATPLLDWTYSPWVAAYFAYRLPSRSTSRWSCVFALDREWVRRRSSRISKQAEGESGQSIVEFVEPSPADNARARAQAGTFTLAPDGVPLEKWVDQNTTRDSENEVPLLRILLPMAERPAALQMLESMRICHQTLFPDLIGAAEQANLDFEMFNTEARFYRIEHLTGKAEGLRDPAFSVEDAKPGTVDPVRSLLRTAKPIAKGAEGTNVTYTARDADGQPVSNAQVNFGFRRGYHIPNPFLASDQGPDATAS